MTSLIPVFPGRPPVLTHHGQIIYVSVHDAWYLRRRAELRTAILDTGGMRKRLEPAIHAYRRFQAEEAGWYRQLGLDPPEGARPRPATPAGLCLRGHVWQRAANRATCPACRAAWQRDYRRRRGAFPIWKYRTACRNGHDATTNLRWSGTQPWCRTCKRDHNRRQRARAARTVHEGPRHPSEGRATVAPDQEAL